MNATAILAAQHRVIEGLFAAAESESRRSVRARLVSRIAEELIAHMAAEEGVFYPALRRVANVPEGVPTEEHIGLRVELRRLLATRSAGAAFLERLHALRELFALHAAEEEMRMFPRIEHALTPAEQELLGEEIRGARPSIWIVTTERRARAQVDQLRPRVSLPMPPAR